MTVCPASGPTQCFSAGVNPNGTFSSLAALGWDVVSADASGFRVNYTWIDVTANNSTGVIEVGAVDGYSGQLVSATTGLPILQGIVTVCDVQPLQPCYPATTTSGSNGTYQGTVPSTGLPVGSVEVTATASGYDPESTFLNLTPGGLTVVPTIRLPPVGVAGGERTPLAARGANSSVPTTGSWVVGRVVDSRSGLGVGNAVLGVCLVVSTGGCSRTSAMTLSGGEFNLSTVHGAYEIWVNATHYATGRVYLNASVAGTVSLGSVPLTELVWVAGRVLIDPWESLGTKLGEGADQVIVTAC
ncbi:MAG: hypothetical protein L3K08_08550, partial [Thermoplasmata archaeon]|nr:hypothetical protein [Thermoplasmata archaeon]